jgi:hypothetical protein
MLAVPSDAAVASFAPSHNSRGAGTIRVARVSCMPSYDRPIACAEATPRAAALASSRRTIVDPAVAGYDHCVSR